MLLVYEYYYYYESTFIKNILSPMTTLISSLRKYAYSLKWNYIIVYKFPKTMITHVPCLSFVVVGGCADTKHRPLTLSASHISFLTRTRGENTFENIAFTYDLEGIIRIQSLLSCNLIYSRFFIIICQILSFNILNTSFRWLWKKANFMEKCCTWNILFLEYN